MKEYVLCSCCDRPIYYADDMHSQDDCYKINGEILCEDCVRPYIEENCKVVLANEA